MNDPMLKLTDVGKNLQGIAQHQYQSVFVSVFLPVFASVFVSVFASVFFIDYGEIHDWLRSILSIVCIYCVLALSRAELILKQCNAMNHPTSLKR